MKSQLIKRMTMLLILVTLSLVTAVVSANGQSSTQQVANIPFGFVVGDKDLPAGEYRITRANAGREVVKITGINNSAAMFRLTTAITRSHPATQTKLVFNRYGDQYFLSELWINGQEEGRQLLKSNREAAVSREYSAVERRLRTNEKPERVEVALK